MLHGGGPPAASHEVEQPGLLAIEILVLWRGDVLAVSHLRPPGSFFVGGAASCCDVCLPVEVLGSERLCVAVSSGNQVTAVLPSQAHAWLTLPDGSVQALEQGPHSAPAAPSERLLPLAFGHRAHTRFDDIEIQVAAVAAGRPPARRASLGFEPSTLAYFGLSSLSVGGLLALLSLLAPPLGLTQDERAAMDQIYLLQSYLTASAERLQLRRDPAPAASREAAAVRALAPRHARAMATSPEPAPEVEPPAVSEPVVSEAGEHTPRASAPRAKALEEARNFGVLSLLGEHLAELDDPRLTYHRELSSSELELMDRMFNTQPDWSEGPAGLSLSGTGLRGGGKADVLELGSVATVSGGEGQMPERFAYLGSPSGSHRPRAPQLRGAGEQPLAPGLVRGAVNARLPRIRECYEAGRQVNSAPAGRVSVHFVVEPDGQVAQVSTQGGDLPAGVGACIQSVFSGLRLPPTGSTSPVPVTYPLQLEPPAEQGSGPEAAPRH